jgi:hypothetical protein
VSVAELVNVKRVPKRLGEAIASAAVLTEYLTNSAAEIALSCTCAMVILRRSRQRRVFSKK